MRRADRHVSFTDHFWLLRHRPDADDAQRRVLDATLVAIAEHGLVPSVQASRMTLAAAPEALQGAVAAGILGCGSVILGASETAGRLLHEVDDARGGSGARRGGAATSSPSIAPRSSAIPGYGHPLHKERDPRVARLFEVAREAGAAAATSRSPQAVEAVLPGADRQGARA